MGCGHGFEKVRPSPPLGWSNGQALRGDKPNGILLRVHGGLFRAKRFLSVRERGTEDLRSGRLQAHGERLGQTPEKVVGQPGLRAIVTAVFTMVLISETPADPIDR